MPHTLPLSMLSSRGVLSAALHRVLRSGAATVLVWATLVQAAAIVPLNDAQIVETLPAGAAQRAAERRLRSEASGHGSAQASDADGAAAQARRLLEQARREGEPRYAGQALAVLQRWPDAARAPDEILLMQATVQQYLHDFDTAAAGFERLLQRSPVNAQAWLSLATLRRVQGRYAESDLACAQLARLGVDPHGAACLAENAALRGHSAAARQSLNRLLAQPRLPDATRSWLLTTLAELEVRAGNSGAAQAAYEAALAAGGDEYTLLSHADFLIENGRAAEALTRLEGRPRSDAVLLRLAIAGRAAKSTQAQGDAAELRDRIAAAFERPDARRAHLREQAMFSLWVDADAHAAVAQARSNLARQREPVDVLLLARAARAAGDAAALREVRHIQGEMGLHDQRLDTLP